VHSRPRTIRPLLAALPVLALLCATALVAGGCASSAQTVHGDAYVEGEPVLVQGTVSDKAGQAIHDVQVELEASRLGFSVYPWGDTKRDVVTGTATTDQQGGYGLQFAWSRLYNHFELVVSIPVTTEHGEDRQELRRMDISRRMGHGSPVAVPVTLEDTAFLDTLREFLASLRTSEEQTTYRQAGKPDRVDRTTFPDHVDTAWWYFEQGKVYRFRDGHLQTVDSFDPVRPVGSAR